jgi:hypothetical protein
LVTRGLFTAQDVNAALKRYVNRLAHQNSSLLAALVRLNGNVADEVSKSIALADERMVARIEARQLSEAKTEAESERAARRAAAPPPNGKVVDMPLRLVTVQGVVFTFAIFRLLVFDRLEAKP